MVPHRLAASKARLVVMLHGGGSNESGRRFADAIDFDSEVERRGWIAVYPDAVAGRFNGGRCCNARVNDLRFIDMLIDEMRRRLGRRPRDVVAGGFSNGGFLAYRLACQRSRQFTAIAVVATTEVTRRCRPKDPVSVLHIQGGKDRKLPPTGGAFKSPSLSALTQRWAHRNGCRRRDADVTATTIDRRATRCRRGSSVQTLLLRDHEHEWPGALPPYGSGAPGAFSATEMIDAFFARVLR